MTEEHTENVGGAGARGSGMEVAVVTGLSGAGRSTAAKCLEDLGWFVVDNLPPELISTMVELGAQARGVITKVAVVMDVRSRAFTDDLASVIKDLDARGYKPRVLFLEATDSVLIRRFDQVRRGHPMQGDGRLVDGITAERKLLAPLREEADLILDTSALSVHDLRAKIEDAFGTESSTQTRSRCCPSATSACRWTRPGDGRAFPAQSVLDPRIAGPKRTRRRRAQLRVGPGGR